MQSVVLPSIPQGVEVGNDGRALVSMLGSGVVAGVPQNTLAVFDRTLTAGQQLLPVTVPALPTTPAPLPATDSDAAHQDLHRLPAAHARTASSSSA